MDCFATNMQLYASMQVMKSMKSIRIVAISIFVLIQSVSVFAGGVRGLIKGDDGAPLPYSTIFVKQTGTGSATDLQGRYEILLSPGSYDILFQFLGYESVSRKITISDAFVEMKFSSGIFIHK